MSLYCAVAPTITIPQAEAVAVQLVPAPSQILGTGEAVITLDLDQDVAGPSTARPVCQNKSKGKGVKRSTTFTSSNTAKTYGDMEDDEEGSFEYPAYLFQEPPSKLKVDKLRKHALIAKVKKDTAIYNFFELAKGILGPMKNALLTVAGTKIPHDKSGGDHAYQAANPTDI